MKKFFGIILTVVLACVLTFAAFSAEDTVYVKSGAKDGNGTYSAPYGNLGTALSKVTGDGAKIVILGDYAITSAYHFNEGAGNVTISGSEGGNIILSQNIAFSESKNSNTITIDIPFTLVGDSTYILFGGFNNIVFGNNFSVNAPDGAKLDFYGGIRSNNSPGICESPYSITVNAGTFNVFAGGNLRASSSYYFGSIAAPVSITINGGTFGTAGNFSTSNNKDYDTFSVSGMSILADDATLVINGGTFNTPIYVQGRTFTIAAAACEKSSKVASDRKYYAIDGDIDVTINGGTFNGGMIGAYYTQAAYTTVMRGNFNVNIKGGTFIKGTKVDATQVKAYEGSNAKATIIYSENNITPVRFDVMNGEVNTYKDPLRVSFIGASITEGYTPDTDATRLWDSFPAVFLKIAEDAGYEVIVGNFGVGSGGYLPSTTRYYYDMLAWAMASEESAPDYVFFQMGTNDANGAGGTYGGQLLFEKNYKDMVTTMGELPDTDKVFMTRSFFRSTSTIKADLRSAAVVRPIQDAVADDLAKTDADKYVPVDLFGLTYDAAKDDSLFLTSYGKIHERLHPSKGGYAILGLHCFNAAFNRIYAPEKDYFMNDIYISPNGSMFGKGTKDDPMSDITVALAFFKYGSSPTLHVMGDYVFNESINLPCGLENLTVVGEGNNASLSVGGGWLKIGSPTKIDNLTLKACASGTAIICDYNDIEITENVKTEGLWSFYAGHNVFGDVDPATTTTFDTVESASSAKDCTAIIMAGSYTKFAFGNGRYADEAPIGTYSGHMNAVVGKNVSILADEVSTFAGINGDNYLTGTIDVSISNWKNGEIKAHVQPRKYANSVIYDRFKDTGSINVTFADGFDAAVDFMCDFNNDGKISLLDAIMAVKYVVYGFDTSKLSKYYGTEVSGMKDIMHVLKKSVNYN